MSYALTLIDITDEGPVTEDDAIVPYLPYPGLEIVHGYTVWKVLSVRVNTEAPPPVPSGEFADGPLQPAPWPVVAVVHHVR